MQGRVFKFLSSIYIYSFILSRIWSYAHVKCALQIINIIFIIIVVVVIIIIIIIITIIIIIITIIIIIIRRFPRSFLCGGPV